MFNSISIKFQICIISFLRAIFELVEENKDRIEVGAATGIVAWLQERMSVSMDHPERVGLIGDLVSVVVDRVLDPEGIEALIAGLPEGTAMPLNVRVEWENGQLEFLIKVRQVGRPTMMSGFEAEVAEEDIINLLGKVAKVAGPLPAPFRNTVADIYLTRALKKIGA